ncbi:MAG: hypothetical protein ICV83_21375 [Cytophagales bacterium]|nr:hypothetical protein [Cytophagales bacterium]
MNTNPVHEKLKRLLHYAAQDFYTDDWWKQEKWWQEAHSFYKSHQQEFNLCLFVELNTATQQLDHTKINALLLLIQGTYYFDPADEKRLAVYFYELLEQLLVDLGPPYPDKKAWNLYHSYDIIWHNSLLYETDRDRLTAIIEKTRHIECADHESGSDCAMALYKAVDLLRLIDTPQSFEVLKRYVTHCNEEASLKAVEALKDIEIRKKQDLKE